MDNSAVPTAANALGISASTTELYCSTRALKDKEH